MKRIALGIAIYAIGLAWSACDVTVSSPEPPADYDSDNDGLLDSEEYDIGTDPRMYDTDQDGLGDGDEVDVVGTDPLDWDTDGDGYGDGDEVANGDDPLVWAP